MEQKRRGTEGYSHPNHRRAVTLWMQTFLCIGLFLGAGVWNAMAQERFTVQSSARGMENAKQAAQIRQIQVKDGQQDSRLDAVESDIGKIADHAWKSIAQCGIGGGASGTGYKITWNPAGSGTWGCIQETDPTVKNFAKTDLPTCSAGQVLRADGTKFICTTSAGSSGFEVDPYVQDFARNTAYTISACAADEILTMTASRLRCIKSRDLSITETDPTVQAFAKTALPTCGAGQVLTSAINGNGIAVLRCVNDTDGGFAETDPKVGAISNNKWCMGSGNKVVCNQNTPVMTEADPKVGGLTNGRWCRASGGKVVCDQTMPTAGAAPCAAAAVALPVVHTQHAKCSGNISSVSGRVEVLSCPAASHKQVVTCSDGGGFLGTGVSAICMDGVFISHGIGSTSSTSTGGGSCK